MIRSTKGSSRRRPGTHRASAVTLTAAMVAVVVTSACSSSSSNSNTGTSGSSDTSTGTSSSTGGSGGSGGSGGGSSQAAAVTTAQLDATIKQALQTSVPSSSLPASMVEALRQASIPMSSSQLTKAFACWKANSCTLGSGKISMAVVDGAEDTWRDFSKMGIILQAMTYADIGKFTYANAGGNLATYQSDIRNATASGAKMIIAYNDFGKAAWPAFATAQRTGAVVSTYVGPNDGAPTSSITTRVQPDICSVGKTMAATTKKIVGSAGVAYFTGTPGNPEDTGWQKCATAEGIHSIFNADTNWTPSGAGTAAAALIASNKPAKAILYSYSNPVPNIVKAYQTANKPIPAIVTWTTDNGTLCLLKKTPFTLYLTNALNWAARVSVTVADDKLNGKSVPASVIYPQPFTKANAANCDPSAPASYPGTSALVPQALTNKMLAGS